MRRSRGGQTVTSPARKRRTASYSETFLRLWLLLLNTCTHWKNSISPILDSQILARDLCFEKAGKGIQARKHSRVPKNMDGYAKVAHLMSKYEEFAILKRFKALNYQNLLYRQAEITYLQEDLERLVDRDATDPARRFYTKNWWALAHTDTKKEGVEQWRKIQQIRKKLDDYSIRYGNFIHLGVLLTRKC